MSTQKHRQHSGLSLDSYVGHISQCLLTESKIPFFLQAPLLCPAAAWLCSEDKPQPRLSWLHLEGSKLLGKQQSHTSEMSNSCV